MEPRGSWGRPCTGLQSESALLLGAEEAWSPASSGELSAVESVLVLPSLLMWEPQVSSRALCSVLLGDRKLAVLRDCCLTICC